MQLRVSSFKAPNTPHAVTGFATTRADLNGSLQQQGRGEIRDYRRTLHKSGIAKVDDLFVTGECPPRSLSAADCQLILTYFGLCTVRDNERALLLDVTKTLVQAQGSSHLEVSKCCPAGYAAVLLNVSHDLVDQLGIARPPHREAGAFGQPCRSTIRLGLLTHRLLSIGELDDPLQADECVVATVTEAFGAIPVYGRCSKAVERAKELLHARSGERLQLEEIAKAVGLSSAYLAQEFRQHERIPLYQYQLQLRLTRALLELPHCDDITGLALDLGFSSHSHFTSAFRKVFGITPSHYRASSRVLPSLKAIGSGRA